jgi:hypothetical protein
MLLKNQQKNQKLRSLQIDNRVLVLLGFLLEKLFASVGLELAAIVITSLLYDFKWISIYLFINNINRVGPMCSCLSILQSGIYYSTIDIQAIGFY